MYNIKTSINTPYGYHLFTCHTRTSTDVAPLVPVAKINLVFKASSLFQNRLKIDSDGKVTLGKLQDEFLYLDRLLKDSILNADFKEHKTHRYSPMNVAYNHKETHHPSRFYPNRSAVAQLQAYQNTHFLNK